MQISLCPIDSLRGLRGLVDYLTILRPVELPVELILLHARTENPVHRLHNDHFDSGMRYTEKDTLPCISTNGKNSLFTTHARDLMLHELPLVTHPP